MPSPSPPPRPAVKLEAVEAQGADLTPFQLYSVFMRGRAV
jgi:hypothetical protein